VKLASRAFQDFRNRREMQRCIVKLFECSACGNVVYFENHACARCAQTLGYDCSDDAMLAFSAEAQAAGAGQEPADRQGLRLCANAGLGVCNWVLPEGEDGDLCAACRHNEIVPDMSDPAHVALWAKVEMAKHRLFYGLLRWKLPLLTRRQDPEHGLAFRILADRPDAPAQHRVLTGHDNGVITIALAEADDLEREKRRIEMGEPYRTLLGHFRHEVGHHYWDVLVRDGGRLEESRAIFGDDRLDYDEALKAHYGSPVADGWQEHFVSAYATTHPWEDFAETWAHYLHIVDTLEMGSAFGIKITPRIGKGVQLKSNLAFDPYAEGDFSKIIDAWLPFVVAMNSINRAMGHVDLYPFILAPDVIRKLSFIHSIIHRVAPVSQTAEDVDEARQAAF
jgi:hypothetical protein